MGSNITQSTVFAVSGGAKGITARCVERLAAHYGCKFLLLGRSKHETTDPGWAQSAQDEAALKRAAMEHLKAQGEKPTPVAVQKMTNRVLSQREIGGTLAEIQRVGGQAEYMSVDITDADAVKQAIADAESRLGAITGIIHGAGVLADKLIENKTAQDFDMVYETKVTGLQNLLAALPPSKLQALVLFSSVAGFYGNVGQADYAIANEVLNKAAHAVKLENPGCRVVSINWGPWDAGMVTPQLKAYFAQHGVKVIPIEVGAHMLIEELESAHGDDVQVVVGSGISTPPPVTISADHPPLVYRSHRKLELHASPFLQDHVVDGKAVLPMVCGMSWMMNAAEGLYPGFKGFSFDDYRVLKGIIFDDDLADEYVMELRETSRSDARIELEAMISSQPKTAKLPRYHYKAILHLVSEMPERMVYPHIDLEPRDNIPGSKYYDDYTLFHHFSFKGVQRVLNISKEKVTLECKLPVVESRYQGQFPVQSFNYYMTDIGFQSMGIYAKYHYGAGSLPLKAGGGEHYQDVPWGAMFYVTLEIHQASETGLVTTLNIHDEQGNMYMRVTGGEITISKRLNDLFTRNILPERLG
jgi:NAD(P)-dependent dehydrogenase (short-subunit alcohol dehydrogenase family)